MISSIKCEIVNMKFFSFILIPVIILSLSCQKQDLIRMTNISSTTVYNITQGEAMASSEIIDTGLGITSFGHCWDIYQSPTIDDSNSTFSDVDTSMLFTSSLRYLKANTIYFLRPYTIESGSIRYGHELQFKTDSFSPPTVITLNFEQLGGATFRVSGEILDYGEGYDSIVSYGHCWAPFDPPTIADSKNVIDTDKQPDEYTSLIRDLDYEQKYFVRAYAINNDGVSYGESMEIITSYSKPYIEAKIIESLIYPRLVTVTVTIIDNGGYAITEMGTAFSDCLDTPTINNPGNYTNYPLNPMQFTHSIDPGKCYSMRAYARNELGVGYSERIKFTSPNE